MAIKVNGTTVINNSRNLTNITSIDSSTATAITNAGVGGGTSVGAWVNFQAFGGNSIRDDANVSSITNHASGDETINFSSSFVDDDYAFAVCSNTDGTGLGSRINKAGARSGSYNDPPTTMSTSALRLMFGTNNDVRDFHTNTVMVVR